MTCPACNGTIHRGRAHFHTNVEGKFTETVQCTRKGRLVTQHRFGFHSYGNN